MKRRLEQSEFERQLEQQDTEQAIYDAKQEVEDRAEQARQEAEDKAEQARQEAEDIIAELERKARIKAASNTSLYYVLFCIALAGLTMYKIVKDKKRSLEGRLKANEKVGVCIALIGTMIALTSLVISEPWIPDFDVWQNLMGIPYSGLDGLRVYFSWLGFGMYARHILLACIALIFYSVTVYLEIFKAPKGLLSKFEDT